MDFDQEKARWRKTQRCSTVIHRRRFLRISLVSMSTCKSATYSLVANTADHSRYRRTLAHAFSDQALRSQESLLNIYFDLFIKKLDEYIDGPLNGKIDIMSVYNQATFDIVGDLAFGEPFHALEAGKYHPWMATVFKSLKLLRWFRVGANYPIVLKAFGVMAKLVPSVRESQKTNLEYTADKVGRRLNTKTDRKDFTSYVSVAEPIDHH